MFRTKVRQLGSLDLIFLIRRVLLNLVIIGNYPSKKTSSMTSDIAVSEFLIRRYCMKTFNFSRTKQERDKFLPPAIIGYKRKDTTAKPMNKHKHPAKLQGLKANTQLVS